MKLLIPLSYLTEACFLSENVTDKKYEMCIEMAEEDLEGILGSQLYQEIKLQYNNNTMSPDNDKLYEYAIKKYIAWRTYYHYLKFAQTDSTATGIRQFSEDNSSLIEDVKLYSLEKNVKARAGQFADRITTYIRTAKKNNTAAFPLFSECGRSNTSFSITSIAGHGKVHQVISINKSISSNE